MSRFISSTRSFSSNHRVRAPLPCTCSSPAGLAFSSPMAAARIHHSPVAGEDVVGPPAKQECVGALVDLIYERPRLVVEVPHGPSVALESSYALLLRRAVSLHHPIDGDLRGSRQFHDRGSLLLGGAPRGRPLTPATNTCAPIRHRLPDFFRGRSATPVLNDPTATVSRPVIRSPSLPDVRTPSLISSSDQGRRSGRSCRG